MLQKIQYHMQFTNNLLSNFTLAISLYLWHIFGNFLFIQEFFKNPSLVARIITMGFNRLPHYYNHLMKQVRQLLSYIILIRILHIVDPFKFYYYYLNCTEKLKLFNCRIYMEHKFQRLLLVSSWQLRVIIIILAIETLQF